MTHMEENVMNRKGLDELVSAVAGWRRQKRHRCQALPSRLVVQAKRAAEVYGVKEIYRLTGIDRKHLKPLQAEHADVSKKVSTAVAPAFTRIELATPRTILPKAEAESPTGFKLRVFELTPETVGLLSSFCHVGGRA